MKPIGRPDPKDAPSWYDAFWALAPGDDLITVLDNNQRAVLTMLDDLLSHQPGSRYAENKWTLKQVLIHLADEERYYTDKAFCCARGCPALGAGRRQGRICNII